MAGPNVYQRLFRGETAFDFAGRWRRWFIVSGAVIVVGFLSLGIQGLNFSIDFRGGTQWQVATRASVSQTRAVLGTISPILSQAQIQTLTNPQTHQQTIKVEAAAKETANSAEVGQVTTALAKLANVTPDQVQLNDVGPSWGSDITDKAIRAVIIFLVVVSAYIWLRFEAKMALAALVALIHDILVTVGIYSLSGFQVSPDTVIAFLTILGYSLYDTIVVFDKVQENTKGLASTGRMTYTDTVNLSMNQVLARSLNTSFVAIIPILSILVIGAWVLGASALEDFGLALFIGLTTGAYSSIFIASPLLALLKERERRYAQIRERLTGRVAGRLTPAAAARGRLEGDPIAAATSTRRATATSGATSTRGWARRRQDWLEESTGSHPRAPAGHDEAPAGHDEAPAGSDEAPAGSDDAPRVETTDDAGMVADAAPTSGPSGLGDTPAGTPGPRTPNGSGPDGTTNGTNGATSPPAPARPGIPPRANRPPPRPRKKGRRR